MKIKVLLLIISALFVSCAKIPIQSVTLIDAITAEGKRMHQLNISMTNKLFSEKAAKVDEFMKKEYTPKYIDNFIKMIPAGTDFSKELPNMMNSMIPKINERRDAMQSALEVNRIKVVDKLNQDYSEYETACSELKELLESAVKVDQERMKLLQKTQEITGSKIDFPQLEVLMDKFITDGGDYGQNIINLNDGINKLLNK